MAFVYVHHEGREVTVQVPLPGTPPTQALLLDQFLAKAPQDIGLRSSLAISLDGESPVPNDDALLGLHPKDDVFVISRSGDAAPTPPPSSAGGVLYFHVYNSTLDDEPFITNRKPFVPGKLREQYLQEVLTAAAMQALRRDGDDLVLKYTVSGTSSPIVWSSGAALPAYPLGGDVLVFGNAPILPKDRKAQAVANDTTAAPAPTPAAGPAAAPAPAPATATAPAPSVAAATRSAVTEATKPRKSAAPPADEEHPFVRDTRARALAQEVKGNYADAGAIYTAAIKECKDPKLVLLLQRALAALWAEKAKVFKRAVPILESIKESTEDAQHLDYVRACVVLGNCYYGMKEYADAADELTGALNYAKAHGVNIEPPVDKGLRLTIGASMFALGKDQGIGVIQDTLKGDTSNAFGVMQMSRAYATKGHMKDAIIWATNLVVQNRNSEEMKENFVFIVKRMSDPVAEIEQHVFGGKGLSADSASAWGWLAVICRDYGELATADSLYRKALQCSPYDASMALNRAHVLEQRGRVLECLQFIAQFLANLQGSTTSLDGESAATELEGEITKAIASFVDGGQAYSLHTEMVRATEEEDALRVIASPTAADFSATPPAKALSSDKDLERQPRGGHRLLTPEELNLGALYLTAGKQLFVLGHLAPLPSLIQRIEPGRQIERFSLTNMKNENAYYTTVGCVLQHLNDPAMPDPRPLMSAGTDAAKLYICSDSHSLSLSWQVISIDGCPTLTVNKLVTGLKIWHLREESSFYPKMNFDAVVRSIPDGSDVLFNFGEIDCREGILQTVQKGVYESHEEAIDVLLKIYRQKLLDLKKRKKLRRVFVLTPPPVLDPTRHIVVHFNRRMVEAFSKVDGLLVVDTTDAVLERPRAGGATPSELAMRSGEMRVLKPELVFDTTHLNPCYTQTILAPALNAALGKS